MTDWENIERLVMSKLSDLEGDLKEVLKNQEDMKISVVTQINKAEVQEKRINVVNKEFRRLENRMTKIEGNRKITVAIITAVAATIGSGIAILGGFING